MSMRTPSALLGRVVESVPTFQQQLQATNDRLDTLARQLYRLESMARSPARKQTRSPGEAIAVENTPRHRDVPQAKSIRGDNVK